MSAETSTLSPLQRAFMALEQARARVAELEGAAREPIAIVGLGCRVPGGGHDPESFWRLLRDGVDAVGPVPPERWDMETLYSPDPEATGRMATRGGGFLRDPVDQFDAAAFSIAPREAASMDPQQRLLLEVCWEALEHAAQAPDALERSRTGVFVGCASSDYSHLMTQAGDPTLLDAHFGSGVAHSVMSGRLSYFLGLQGPSLTLDTACSSSLVAIHLACQSLRSGECRMALAGGVNLMLSPDLLIALSHARMLAPDGRCKSFSASADGYGRAEGCGIVVLKRLSDARADGDRVLAVIRGSAVNQDGPSSSLTAPNGPAQEAVIREALDNGNVSPADVGYIEAHGTGTELGDPLEVQALDNVFGPGRDRARPLVIGAVKTNLGHLEAAAGVVGLIKLVLALRHGVIPKHLHFDTPSPHIPWADYALKVPTEAMDWPAIGGKRIGGVSSFGFSGTNAHVVVEEAPALEARAPQSSAMPCLLALSAHDDKALAVLAARYAAALEGRGDAELADFCATANAGRAQLGVRATVMASGAAQLRDRLAALGRGEAVEGVRQARSGRRDPPRVAFLFTGQGSQHAGMARKLYETEPVFRAALDRCAELLAPRLGKPLLEVVFGDAARLDETAYTQPALFAVEYALAELWRSWGVTPSVVMGHSVGEYAAACVAGVLGLEEALALVAERGRLMQSLPPGGAMAAIYAPEAEVAAAIAGDGARVSIAAVNGPAQTVITGEADAVRKHGERFAARGIQCKPLAVSHAFHSPLVEPVLDAFERAATKTTFASPKLRLVSNLTGRLAQPGELAQPRYWRRHMREAVRFGDGLATLATLKPDVVLEIGPHPTLIAFAQAALDPQPPMLASLRKGRDDREQVLDSLAQLWLAGAPIDWRAVSGAGRRVVDLPTYPFQRERHWFRAAPKAGAPRGRDTGNPLVGTRLRSAAPGAIFEARIGADGPAFMRQHRALDRVVVPVTAYLELLAAAGAEALATERVAVENLAVREAMLFEDDGSARIVQSIVEPPRDGAVEITIASEAPDAGDDEPWVPHVTGSVRPASAPELKGASLAELRARITDAISHEDFYAVTVRRGLAFGHAFRSVLNAWRGENEALGEVHLVEELRAEASSYRFHPVLLDGCLQAIGAALPDDPEDDQPFLPLGIGSYTLHAKPSHRCWVHIAMMPGEGGSLRSDLRVFADDGSLVAELRDVQFMRVTRDAFHRLGQRWIDECLYETRWPETPARGEQGAAPDWTPAELVQAGARHVPALVERAGIAEYDIFLPQIESLCADYTVRAMQRLGWAPAVGERFEEAELARRLRVIPRHNRLFARLLAILTEGGWLARDGASWRVLRPWGEVDPQRRNAEIAARCPTGAVELEFTHRSAMEFAEALRGEREPMQLLFPGGNLDTAQRLYRDTPTAKFYSGLMSEVIAAAAAKASTGRPLRILEVGGGTGGTTAHVLPRLPKEGIEYTFTDVGPLFVANARERFGPQHAGFRFQVLDLEREPAEQGFAGQQFDLVIAANVIHATARLRSTLARVRGLLAPGGMLAMLEVTAPQRWFDLTVGLTEGWWAFADTDLRTDYATLTREGWTKLLAECGFDSTEALPQGDRLTGALGLQSLLLARAGAESEARDWLLFADEGGAMAGLAAKLRARGDRCALVHAATRYAAEGDDFRVRPESLDDYRKAIAELRSRDRVPHGVVHGWALDGAGAEPASREELDAAQRRGVLSALRVAQALVSENASSRLWLVARGAQRVADADRASSPTHAPLAGLAKSLALEHPQLKCVAVDLDPGTHAAELDALVAELSETGTDTLVGLREDGRHAARLARLRRDTAKDTSSPWRLTPAQKGSLDRFDRAPLERRAPGPGEVEVAVEVAGLNFRDVLNALGMYPGDAGPLGVECAGRVSAVGPGVEGLRVGDAVLAVEGGSLATHLVTRKEFVQPIPEGASMEEAASFGVAFATAEFCLGHLAGLARGESVLIHAAAGGVGMAAVRIAQRVGAEIYATAGSPWKRELLHSMGVRHVLDSRSSAFADEVLRLTGGRGVDVVLNALSGEQLDAGLRAIARGGRFVEMGKRGIKTEAEVAALKRDIRYFVFDWVATGRSDPALIGRILESQVRGWREGALAPLPRHVFPVSEAARAFRFMAQARHVGRIVLRVNAPVAPAIRGDGTYLVTGGLSGLGLVVARWLATRGAGRIVLIGRRGITPEAAGVVEALRAEGTEVLAEALDVSDEKGLVALLARIRASGPPLRGIVHSAGTLADAGLLQQDDQRFAHVYAPKVHGGRLLDALTRSDPLELFVIFSSAASVLGSPGQANHCAANAWLDMLAHERRGRGLPAVSINWGPWAQVGAAVDRGVSERLASQGLKAVTPEHGIATMERLIELGVAQAAVLDADWPRYAQARPGTFVSELAGARRSAPAAAAAAAAKGVELRDLLKDAPPGRTRPILAAFLLERVQRALGLDPGRAVDPRRPLGELGLDSLLAVELRNALGTAIGRPLPATLLFDYPTLESLTDLLLTQVAGGGAPAAAAPEAPTEGLVDSIEDLSDDEVDRLLAKRTSRTVTP